MKKNSNDNSATAKMGNFFNFFFNATEDMIFFIDNEYKVFDFNLAVRKNKWPNLTDEEFNKLVKEGGIYDNFFLYDFFCPEKSKEKILKTLDFLKDNESSLTSSLEARCLNNNLNGEKRIKKPSIYSLNITRIDINNKQKNRNYGNFICVARDISNQIYLTDSLIKQTQKVNKQKKILLKKNRELKENKLSLEQRTTQLEKTNKQLSLQKLRYKNLSNVSNTGQISVNQDGKIIDLNDVAQEEILDNPFSMYFGRNFDEFVKGINFKSLFERYKKQSSFTDFYNLEINGKKKWFETSFKLLSDEGNKRVYVINLKDMDKLYNQAINDSLLKNFYKKNHFMKLANMEIERSKRYDLSFSLAMFDIDYFKNFNDSHGHLNGDKALIKTAEVIYKHVRPTDIRARYGGEEFIILFPQTKIDQGYEICERIRQCVKETKIQVGASSEYVSISGGISEYPYESNDLDQLITIADTRLYFSKNNGRDKITKD